MNAATIRLMALIGPLAPYITEKEIRQIYRVSLDDKSFTDRAQHRAAINKQSSLEIN